MPFEPVARTRPADCSLPQFFPLMGRGDAIQSYPSTNQDGDTSNCYISSVACLDNNRAIVVFEESGYFDDVEGANEYTERVFARIITRDDGVAHAKNIVTEVIDPADLYYGYVSSGRFNVVAIDSTHALCGMGYATDTTWDTIEYRLYLLKLIDEDTIEVVDTYASTFNSIDYVWQVWNEIAVIPGSKRFIACTQGKWLITGEVNGDTITAVETVNPRAIPESVTSDVIEDPKIAADSDGKFIIWNYPDGAWPSSIHGYFLCGEVDPSDLSVTFGDFIPFPDQYLYNSGGDNDPPIAVLSDGEFVVIYDGWGGSSAHHNQPFGCPVDANEPTCTVNLDEINSPYYEQARLIRVSISDSLELTFYNPHVLDANTGWNFYYPTAVSTGPGKVTVTYNSDMLYEGGVVISTITQDDTSPSGLIATDPARLRINAYYGTYYGSGATTSLWPDNQEVLWIGREVFEIIETDWPTVCEYEYIWSWDWSENAPGPDPSDYHYGTTLFSLPIPGVGGGEVNVSYFRKFNPFSKVLSKLTYTGGFVTDTKDVAIMLDGTQRRSTYNRIYLIDENTLKVLHHPDDLIERDTP